MLPVHERLAELWVIRSRRPLTDAEEMDFAHCLEVNASYIRQLAHLKNLSLLAAMTNDTEWQREISRRIGKLTAEGI
ncbi:MAG: hypothetical protein A9Z00_14695 [Thermobacillus sp. ZCTH02-B1]|nr:MAG: hypothetical protein A9Z00_14695 [Thermobacillus sp. ZCTH02-B1]